MLRDWIDLLLALVLGPEWGTNDSDLGPSADPNG